MSDFDRQIDAFNKRYSEYMKTIQNAVLYQTRISGNKMQNRAQQIANFRQSGKNTPSLAPEMNRSITNKAEKIGESIRLSFWIDPTFVTRYGKDGTPWNITWIHNDGTGFSYRKGNLSPAVIPRLKSRGLQGKYFMDIAWNEESPKLQKAIREIPAKVKKKLFNQ